MIANTLHLFISNIIKESIKIINSKLIEGLYKNLKKVDIQSKSDTFIFLVINILMTPLVCSLHCGQLEVYYFFLVESFKQYIPTFSLVEEKYTKDKIRIYQHILEAINMLEIRKEKAFFIRLNTVWEQENNLCDKIFQDFYLQFR